MHVALLKSIIKDIEDVARTPASTLGASQSSTVNPGGGHPQIIEGVCTPFPKLHTFLISAFWLMLRGLILPFVNFILS